MQEPDLDISDDEEFESMPDGSSGILGKFLAYFVYHHEPSYFSILPFLISYSDVLADGRTTIVL